MTTGDGTSDQWQPGPNELKTIRGMIIDRDKAWRADPTWGPLIDRAIRKGLKKIDENTFFRIYQFLWHGGLPGSYVTKGFDAQQMRRAWRKYLQRHYRLKPKPKMAPELAPEPEAQEDPLQAGQPKTV